MLQYLRQLLWGKPRLETGPAPPLAGSLSPTTTSHSALICPRNCTQRATPTSCCRPRAYSLRCDDSSKNKTVITLASEYLTSIGPDRLIIKTVMLAIALSQTAFAVDGAISIRWICTPWLWRPHGAWHPPKRVRFKLPLAQLLFYSF